MAVNFFSCTNRQTAYAVNTKPWLTVETVEGECIYTILYGHRACESVVFSHHCRISRTTFAKTIADFASNSDSWPTWEVRRCRRTLELHFLIIFSPSSGLFLCLIILSLGFPLQLVRADKFTFLLLLLLDSSQCAFSLLTVQSLKPR